MAPTRFMRVFLAAAALLGLGIVLGAAMFVSTGPHARESA